MRTKEQNIDLLMKFVKGEVTIKALKKYKLTWFFCLQDEQRKKIAAKLGNVRPANCSPYHPSEPICALWNGVPIGFYLTFHLSMFEHPDSFVELIDCTKPDIFNEFIDTLPQKKLTS